MFISFAANFAAFTKKGIQLTNLFAVTHPSEPNYVSVAGGDYFGMDNDDLHNVPENISSIVDLLEERGIAWAEYQEDMPSTGYTGFEQLNVQGANDYVRKHKCANKSFSKSQVSEYLIQPPHYLRLSDKC